VSNRQKENRKGVFRSESTPYEQIRAYLAISSVDPKAAILLGLALRIDRLYPGQPANHSDKEWIEEKFCDMEDENDER